MSIIVTLSEASYDGINLVGGKAAALGKMLQAGIVIPKGFVITTKAFDTGLSELVAEEILRAFDDLGAVRVAVRSSAIAEDSQAASWAGQLESYLNVTKEGLVESVRNCWASISSERAINYASENNVTNAECKVAVIVQAMVDSNISGVLFTANPINKSDGEFVIESVFGLGELLVQGTVTPETLIINRAPGTIKERMLHQQEKKLVYRNGQNVVVPLEPGELNREILNDKQLASLCQTAELIESYFAASQDIEWAFEQERLYVLQSRPITTL